MNRMKLIEKVQKDMPEFAAEVATLSPDDCKNRLSTLSENLTELEDAEENDSELQTAKQTASELGAPYRDGKKAIKLRRRYLSLAAKGEL